MPRTALDAKFSVQFLTAKALQTGIIKLADFEEGKFLTPQIEGLLARTTSQPHRDANQYLGRVRVTLKNGQVLEQTASTNFGRGSLNPMSDAELMAKFSDCVSAHIDAGAAEAAFAAILDMDKANTLTPVMAAFA